MFATRARDVRVESCLVQAQAAAETTVKLTFTTDRDGVCTAWNAIVNLADLADQLTATVKAMSEKGFDKSKLR
jgi:hypothetical protein